MKHYFLYIALFLLATSCSNEETLTPNIDFSNDFSIVDDPNDSVQHARYEIFKEYNVPVYFNDTIVRRPNGVDRQGKPMYKYETVDLNWTFSGYDRNVTYTYKYLTDPHEQMNALRYVKEYLRIASKPMRPFSIMLADTLTISTQRGDEQPQYHVGPRTLVFAQVKDISSPDEVRQTVSMLIKNMISDRIKNNLELCARFAAVCSAKDYYTKEWSKLGNCPTIERLTKMSWTLSVNELYNEPPFKSLDNIDLVERLTEVRRGSSAYIDDYEEAIRIRRKVIIEMGQFGFIRGWKHTGTYVPNDADEDRQYFIEAIMHLGEIGFKRRYETFPLVMEKYKLLADFITKHLGVSLDYDGMSEDEKSEDYTENPDDSEEDEF